MKKIGIYNPYLETKGGGEKVCLALAETLAQNPDNKVTFLTHAKIDLDDLARYFNIDLSKTSVEIIRHNRVINKLLSKIKLPARVHGLIIDFQTKRTIRNMNFDLFINNCYQSSLPNPSKKGVYMCMFPQKLPGTNVIDKNMKQRHKILMSLNRVFMHPGKNYFFETYDVITANSKYTQDYITSFWDSPSDILYPICEDMRQTPAPKKEKIILNVGRFFENTAESHNKRQDFLVEAFTEMEDLHKEGWELHFAGTVAKDVGTLNYILDLMSAAAGYPVYFHYNSSFADLQTLYNKASVYWHATGYGVKPEKFPEKQEHFGISTVEAMSAGAIPVVINTAGQKEVVQDGKNGYLWNDKAELQAKTRKITKSDQKHQDVRSNARKTLEEYDTPAFRTTVKHLFEEI